MTDTETEADDILTVRPDGRRSRYSKKDPATPGPDPDDVAGVDEKVDALRETYPLACIETDVIESVNVFGAPTFRVKARVWITEDTSGRPQGTGNASRTYGVGDAPYCFSPLEWAESVAIGRALRFLGFPKTDRTGDTP